MDGGHANTYVPVITHYEPCGCISAYHNPHIKAFHLAWAYTVGMVACM